MTDPDWYSFICAATRAYEPLISALAEVGETSAGYRRPGAMVVARSPERLREIRADLLARREHTPEIGEVDQLSPAQARELFPPLHQDLGGVYLTGGARVDGGLLAAAMRRAAQRTGVRIMEGTAQLHLGPDGRAAGVRADGELVEADAVVAAAGAWTDDFLAPAGLRLGVTPQRGQIVHIGLPSTDTSRWPVVEPDGSSHYLLAFDDSRVVAGATRETGAGFDYWVTPAGLAEVLTQALAVAPGLAGGTYLQTRVGFRPMGPDIRPLLGPLRASTAWSSRRGCAPRGSPWVRTQVRSPPGPPWEQSFRWTSRRSTRCEASGQ